MPSKPTHDLWPRNIQFTWDEVPPESWDTPLLEPPKPRIRIPGRNRTISEFAIELAEHIKYTEPYYDGDVMFVKNETDGRYEEMTPDKFVTWIEKHVVCREGELGQEGPPYEALPVGRRSGCAGSVCLTRRILKIVADEVEPPRTHHRPHCRPRTCQKAPERGTRHQQKHPRSPLLVTLRTQARLRWSS